MHPQCHITSPAGNTSVPEPDAAPQILVSSFIAVRIRRPPFLNAASDMMPADE
jgi:hypothetical protein